MALTTINSDGIKNDSIKNIDIKSDAAIEGSKLDNPLQLPDDHKISFGTTGTGDLEIYHSSGNSFIHDGGAGGLYIRGSILGWRDAGNSNASWINANSGAGVELYYAGNKKLQTISSGIIVENSAAAIAEIKLQAANDQDCQFVFNSDNGDDYTDNLRLYQYASNGNFYIQHNTASGTWETSIQSAPNGAVSLYYDSGTPKFETTSTGAKTTGRLQIYNQNDANYNVLDCYNDNDQNNGGFSQNSDGDGTIFAKYADANANMQFGVLLRSDGDSYFTGGNVGIGTDDPADHTAAYRSLELSGTTGGVIVFSDDEVNKWEIWASGSEFGIYDRASGRYNLKCYTSSGDVEVITGNLKLPATKGIDFSAYATSGNPSSNLLDDYEEGTFTPVWEGSTTAGNPTYGQNMGRYTKIGNTVHCNGYSELQGNGGTAPAGTNFYINNLPFVSAANASMPYECGSVMFDNLNFNDSAKWWVSFKPADNTKMYFYYTQDNGAWSHLNCDDTVFSIIWSLTYKIGTT